MFTSLSARQSLKAENWIVETVLGSITCSNEEQFAKAEYLIVSTPSGTVMVLRSQPAKALIPIDFTLPGILTVLTFEQS